MLLKDCRQFKLPRLLGGWFSGMDRHHIPHNNLILKEVLQRDDNGDISLICQAKDGLEEKRGWIKFPTENRSEKDALYNWLQQRIGQDIETIYHSDFIIENEKLTK